MPGCLFVLFYLVDYNYCYYWASQSIPEYASVRYLVISISSIKVGRHTAYINMYTLCARLLDRGDELRNAFLFIFFCLISFLL